MENPVAVDHRLSKSLPCSLPFAETLLNECRLVLDHMNSCHMAMMFHAGNEFSEKWTQTPLGVIHVHDGEGIWSMRFYELLQAFVYPGYEFLLGLSSFKSLYPELCEFTAFEACEAEVSCSRSNGEGPGGWDC